MLDASDCFYFLKFLFLFSLFMTLVSICNECLTRNFIVCHTVYVSLNECFLSLYDEKSTSFCEWIINCMDPKHHSFIYLHILQTYIFCDAYFFHINYDARAGCKIITFPSCYAMHKIHMFGTILCKAPCKAL